MRRSICTRALLATILFTSPCVAQSQPSGDPPPAPASTPSIISDEDSGWSFQLPDGWYPISPEGLQAGNDAIARAGVTTGLRYTHGFTTSPDGALRWPYFMVQVTPDDSLRGADYDDVQQMINAGFAQAPDAIKDMDEVAPGVQGQVAGAPIVDRLRGLATFDLSVQVPGGVPMRTFSWMFFGRDRLVQLNFYSAESDASLNAPRFESIASTFAFAPGRAFVPSSLGPISGQPTGSTPRRAIAVTLVLALAAGGIYVLFRKLSGPRRD